MLKYITAFSAGALIGGLATYIFLNKKYEQIANEEIESVKEYYNEQYKEDKRKKYSGKYKWGNSKVNDDIFAYESQTDRINYAKKNFSEDWEVKNEKMLAENEHPMDDENDDKYLIDLDTYSHGDSNYDKVTLEYYPESDTLWNCDDHEVMDIEETIGHKNLNNFGGSFEDFPDTMFIRNEKLGIDFEVVKYDSGELIEKE